MESYYEQDPQHNYILEGNYQEIMTNCGLANFCAEEPNLQKQLAKDLSRTKFIETANSSHEQFLAAWQNAEISNKYSQGNMDGGPLGALLLKQYFLASSSFEDPPETYELKFAYIDDAGVISGCSIVFVPDDPSLWIASILKNPHLDPKERQMSVFLNNFYDQNLLGISSPIQEVKEQFLTKLHSHELNELFDQIIDEQNQLNINRILPVYQAVAKSTVAHIKAQNLTEVLSTLKKPPIQLDAKEITLANLQLMHEQGYKISQHFFSINEDAGMSGGDSNYAFWICEDASKPWAKIVFFAPSRDIKEINYSIPDTQVLPYILDTQKVAKHFVEQGYTCLLPVGEYQELALTQFTNISTARKHWVTLIWNKDYLKFFDPKSSSNLGGAIKYDNTVFKDFSKFAGFSVNDSLTDKITKRIGFNFFLNDNYVPGKKEYYDAVKEAHPQGTFDMNNCGYFVSARLQMVIEALRKSTGTHPQDLSLTSEKLQFLQENIDNLKSKIVNRIALGNLLVVNGAILPLKPEDYNLYLANAIFDQVQNVNADTMNTENKDIKILFIKNLSQLIAKSKQLNSDARQYQDDLLDYESDKSNDGDGKWEEVKFDINPNHF